MQMGSNRRGLQQRAGRSPEVAMGMGQDGVDSALERSRRGGHLWILAEKPLLARDCRLYIYTLENGSKYRSKASGQPRGLRCFRSRTMCKQMSLEMHSEVRLVFIRR